MEKTKLHIAHRDYIGDLDTPVTLFLKLNESPSFLLESVTGGEQIARYSFIGFNPFITFKAQDNQLEIQQNGETISKEGNSIDALRNLVNQFHLEADPSLPPFLGGAVGFFSWEIMSQIEKLEFAQKNGAPFPDAHFIFPGALVVVDHVLRKIFSIVLYQDGHEAQAEETLNSIEERIQKPLSVPLRTLPTLKTGTDPYDTVKSNMSKETFENSVIQAKKHIFEGDIFQIVLSQQFNVKSEKSPFDVYRSLRYLNPSPYMFYMAFDDYQLIGSSPEILVRAHDNKAELRPLAGTRPRIKGQEEALIKDLLSDEKEKAEHVMLVDLGRNDLGRVCKPGTVKTTDLMEIEKYSHVLHIVSNVEGEILPNQDAFDLFKATFPAGTVSGAPKIRAIEIIEALEPDRRGPYSGALGYFDFRGNMDLCIIIRTIVSTQKGEYRVQAGAGIVADSDPETEYKESQNKARGMLLSCLGDKD